MIRTISHILWHKMTTLRFTHWNPTFLTREIKASAGCEQNANLHERCEFTEDVRFSVQRTVFHSRGNVKTTPPSKTKSNTAHCMNLHKRSSRHAAVREFVFSPRAPREPLTRHVPRMRPSRSLVHKSVSADIASSVQKTIQHVPTAIVEGTSEWNICYCIICSGLARKFAWTAERSQQRGFQYGSHVNSATLR